jgi:hypothetical protein
MLVGGIALALAPAHLCRGLDGDIHVFDQCARNVLEGGVAYRDVPEINLPGMTWLHVAVRGLFGWRPEALRAVDLGVLAVVVGLLAGWTPAAALGGWGRPLTAVLLLVQYLGSWEWCHCQRDVWMMVPALLALQMRARQADRLNQPPAASGRLFAAAFVEGALWATAFWIKPFVAVPCVLCWLSATVPALRMGSRRGRVLLDGLGVLAGGVVVGLAGIAWLVQTGAWPYFTHIMFVLNPQYAGHDFSEGNGAILYLAAAVRFLPWSLVHLAAVPVAAADLWSAWRARPGEGSRCGLLACCYLGWLLQAVAIQHPWDYVHMPPLLLGTACLCARLLVLPGGVMHTAALSAAVLALGLWLPSLLVERLPLWSACVREGSTPAMRDRLQRYPLFEWQHLDAVAAELRRRGAADGEVTCFSLRTLPLLAMLHMRPSTRSTYLETGLAVMPHLRKPILDELAASRQKYIVCDLHRLCDEANLDPGTLPAEADAPLPIPQYLQQPMPWKERIVFRAGRYVLLAVSGPEMPVWVHTSFGY